MFFFLSFICFVFCKFCIVFFSRFNTNNNININKNTENKLIIKEKKNTGKGKKRLKLESTDTAVAVISMTIQKQIDENLTQRSRNHSSGSKENETEVKVNAAADMLLVNENIALQGTDSDLVIGDMVQTKLRRSRSSTLNSTNDLCTATNYSEEIKSIKQEKTVEMYAFH